ncbi:NAD-dependent epimerase/dehydratase family protein [Nocardia sp. NPDC051030]|uniref:NAD-dependent epimerase/dehydratase family protein n=1 Tax=Nocardia sp. NPDC051030 TaxID=3155162 RepID=UPI00341AFC26
MRVLVTGAGGYLGRAVVAALNTAGHTPIAMVHTPGDPISGATETRIADLLDVHTLARTVDGMDAVCHLAGLTRARESLTDPLRYFRVNTSGTITLLEAMAEAGVPRLVFASTASIYAPSEGEPLTEDAPDAPPHPYAASKLAAEHVIEAQARTGALAATILRVFNLTGGSGADPTGLTPRTLAATAASPLQINGSGTAIRDYLHVSDAADAFAAAISVPQITGVVDRYNIGSGTGTSLLDIVAMVERVTGRPVPRTHKPPVPEPAALVSAPGKASANLSWSPTRSNLESIIRDAPR